MALTRITKGVIKPNENYDTHDINSTGIITATGLNVSGNASIGGVLTYEDVTNIDSIGIITARSDIKVGTAVTLTSAGAGFYAGIITASDFVKRDGSSLGGAGGLSIGNNANTYSNNSFSNITSNSQYNTIIGWNAGNAISTGDHNTIYGYRAGGVHNNSEETIIGANCFSERGSHTYAVGLGYGAGKWNEGNYNTAIGYESVGAHLNSDGNNNTGLGFQALRQIRSGSNNVALGFQADNAATTGSNRIVIGANADASAVDVDNEITLGDSNINHLRVPGIGVSFSTNGNHITGVTTFSGEIHGNGQRLGSLSGGGRFSGLFLNNGSSYYGTNKLLVADGNGFGFSAYASNDSWLKANTGGGSSGDCYMKTGGSSGGYVYAKGADGVELHHSGTSDKKLETVSGGINIVGSLTVNGAAVGGGLASDSQENTLAGTNAGDAIQQYGERNCFFGFDAGTDLTTGSDNIFIGHRAGEDVTVSNNNTVIGSLSGERLTDQGQNTFVGGGAGMEVTSPNNIYIGYYSGKNHGSGSGMCIGIGNQSNYYNGGRIANIAIGHQALYGNFSYQKEFNLALGHHALYTSRGDFNLGIGVSVGGGSGDPNITGTRNTLIGTYAGQNLTSGSDNTIIGDRAGDLIDSGTNCIIIGHDAESSSTSVSNEITLGDSNINHLRVPGIGVSFSTGGNHITGITTFKDRIKIGNSGNGQLYYSGGIKMESTAQIELKSANQMYLHAQSSGLFLFASNQEVVSVYGGSGGGVYFRHNGTQKLKLENGNWTYQGSPTVTFDGNILASSGSAIDIGTNSVRFRNIYADTFTDSKGDLRDIPQNSQGSTYTLVASDAGKHVKALADITIPSGVFSIGEAVTIINSQSNSITIIQGSSTTVYNTADGSTGNRTLAGRGMATFICTDTNYFYISGSGMT